MNEQLRELDGHDLPPDGETLPIRCDRCEVAEASWVMTVQVRKRVRVHHLSLYFCNGCAREIEREREEVMV